MEFRQEKIESRERTEESNVRVGQDSYVRIKCVLLYIRVCVCVCSIFVCVISMSFSTEFPICIILICDY